MHLPFLVIIGRLLNGFRYGFKDSEFRALLIFVIILLFTGTVFYSNVEGWKWLDSLYFSVTTLTTVGFGDFVPKTNAGKIFTIIYLIIGVGTLLSFVTVMAEHAKNNDPFHKRLVGDSKED